MKGKERDGMEGKAGEGKRKSVESARDTPPNLPILRYHQLNPMTYDQMTVVH